jgi:hypothetical protein
MNVKPLEVTALPYFSITLQVLLTFEVTLVKKSFLKNIVFVKVIFLENKGKNGNSIKYRSAFQFNDDNACTKI